MKKRFIASIMAGIMLLSQPILAQERDAADILMEGIARGADITSGTLTGEISLSLVMEGLIHAEVNIPVEMVFDVDIDSGVFVYYVRMPMEINAELYGVLGMLLEMAGEDTSISETMEVAVFFDGENLFTYLTDYGWFVEELDDFVTDMYADMFSNWEQMMEMSMTLYEFLFELVPPVFAQEQAEGVYVIDMVIDNAVMLDIIREWVTVENLFALVEWFALIDPAIADELAGITDEEWEEVAAVFEEELPFVIALIEEAFNYVEFTILLRDVVDAQTYEFVSNSAFIDMVIDTEGIVVLLGMEEFLEFGLAPLEFSMYFNVSFDAVGDLVWPDVVLQ